MTTRVIGAVAVLTLVGAGAIAPAPAHAQSVILRVWVVGTTTDDGSGENSTTTPGGRNPVPLPIVIPATAFKSQSQFLNFPTVIQYPIPPTIPEPTKLDQFLLRESSTTESIGDSLHGFFTITIRPGSRVVDVYASSAHALAVAYAAILAFFERLLQEIMRVLK